MMVRAPVEDIVAWPETALACGEVAPCPTRIWPAASATALRVVAVPPVMTVPAAGELKPVPPKLAASGVVRAMFHVPAVRVAESGGTAAKLPVVEAAPQIGAAPAQTIVCPAAQGPTESQPTMPGPPPTGIVLAGMSP